MKKSLCFLLTICLLFSLSACKSKKNEPSTESTSGSTDSQVTPNVNQVVEDKTVVAIAVPAVTEDTFHQNGTILFQYTYQDISLFLNKPDVADKIILDFMTRIDSTKESATSTADMAQSAYRGETNWMPYMYSVLYSPTRIDHNVLSFSGSIEEYTGGPHPNRSRISASYDLKTGDILTLASIMQKDASVSAIRDLVLEVLNKLQSSTTLYENYQATVTERFSGDASINEDWYFTQTGLCFDFSPYEIAPYSSGIITAEVPYEKLTAILHEDYLPAARNTPQGTVQFITIENFDMSNPNKQFAEIVTDRNGSMIVAQTDNYVQNIRITDTSKASSYTAFAAYALYKGDGIIIQTSNDLRAKMTLTYKSGNQTISTPIG